MCGHCWGRKLGDVEKMSPYKQRNVKIRASDQREERKEDQELNG